MLDHFFARTQGSVVYRMIFVLLLAAVSGVFLLLPQYIDHNRAEDQITEKGQLQPADENALHRNEPDHTSNQQRAEAYRVQFLKIKSTLVEKGTAHWGGEDYVKILTQAERAEKLFQQRREKSAEAAYESVLADIERFQNSINRRVSTAISSGEQALEEGNGDRARRQFNLALSIEPENIRAKKGMKRVESSEKISSLLLSGNKKEAKGQWHEAMEDYKKAERLDGEDQKARQSREKVERIIAEQTFNKAMSRGFIALKQSKYDEAGKAFTEARNIKPQAIEAVDALNLTDRKYKSHKINVLKRQALVYETEEKWQEAEKTYMSALELDPYLEFATEGVKRSLFFLGLNNELDHLINHPGRLSSDKIYYKAQQLLQKAESQEAKGPKLNMKIDRAGKILAAARTAIPVTLESDGRTEVVVYKIGRLGRFDRRTLNLYPGTYTAVGGCSGYQDIRKEFSIAAGAVPEAIEIRCKEAL